MKARDVMAPTLLGLVLLAGWEALVRWQGLSALVLPAPSAVAASLQRALASGFLWPHVLATVSEVAGGLLLGALAGFAGGVLLAESGTARRLLMPYIVTSQVVPKLALGPLFILWFGFGRWPTIVMTALICFFPLLENTLTALRHVDTQQLELFRMLRASRWQTLWQLKIPAGWPGILAGLRVAVVLAWVGAVVGEFIGASQGLGALVIAAQGSMDTALMFAVLTVITALGLASYLLTDALQRRWLGRRSLPLNPLEISR